MNKWFILFLICIVSIGYAEEKYIECVKGNLYFAAEISAKDGQQFILANVELDNQHINHAKILLDGIHLQYKLPIKVDLSKFNRSTTIINLPIYYARGKQTMRNHAQVDIQIVDKIYSFKNVPLVASKNESQEQNISANNTDPIDIAFEDIRIELGGGIKVIHIKIYDFTQIGQQGVTRMRFKTKKYNPVSLIGVGALDYLGNLGTFFYHHSFKGNRYFEVPIDVEMYNLLLCVHTGTRYRFAKYGTTKAKRVLVNKANSPITNMKFTVTFDVNGKKLSYSRNLKQFSKTVFDLNPYYQITPVLGRTTAPLSPTLAKENIFPETPENKEDNDTIVIYNTCPETITNLQVYVSYSSAKGKNTKEVTFDPAGNEEVELD